jgi:hypothetical protein
MPFNSLHDDFIIYNMHFFKADVDEGRYDQTVRVMQRNVE